jgi:hypothetical protein
VDEHGGRQPFSRILVWPQSDINALIGAGPGGFDDIDRRPENSAAISRAHSACLGRLFRA